ncbi:FecR family protein [Pedobacter alpinus]|uniref:FecR family protein n=1 Tax=Pedobacter alpinus TaxID=1590643 RepID=A0ABW5TVP0_9SPHI
MEQSKFKELLDRFTKGKANETESALVDAWYKSYQANEDEISINEVEKTAIKQYLTSKIKQSPINPNKSIIPIYYRIAAAIAIIFTAGIVFQNWKSKKLETPASYNLVSTKLGQIKKVTLPDSSIVWLNANSVMRVNSNFEAGSREIFLDEGEAFFKVTKNPKKPFIVQHNEVSVKVLGTSFNVKAYKNLPDLKVAVSTGKVQVKSEKNAVLLYPKQEAVYHSSNKSFETHQVNDNEVSLWREGKIYLHQANFKELALILSNNFKINLKAASSAVLQYQFTLNISTDMKETELLKIISSIHNSKYRKEGNSVILY